MRIKRTLLAVAILIAVPALGQKVEHAPTAAQCQADQRLWLSRLEDNADRLKDVTVRTVPAWQAEMQQCQAVDPENQRKYANTRSEAEAEIESRKGYFISRHGLYGQFLAEDAAGQR